MTLRSLLILAAFAAAVLVPALPAAAQQSYVIQPYQGQPYQQWQPGWDHGQYDRNHVVIGTVTNFQPFRLQLARPNGTVQTIDLKNGTRIFPRGETPSTNQRVAVTGYYSNGTFIADRVVLRD